MVYDNEDEFGIDSYREDFEYVFSMNKILVKRLKRRTGTANIVSGDFMGLDSVDDDVSYDKDIYVNINSYNFRQKELRIQGHDYQGLRLLTGFVLYNTELNSGDIIEFKQNDNKYNILEGERYVIEIEDVGPIKGQFCYRNFKAYSVGKNRDLE